MPESFTFEEATAKPESFTFEEAAPRAFTFEEASQTPDATVSQMAAATRHTVGVVGRTVAALDMAQAGANAMALPAAPEAVATDEFGRPLDPRGRNPVQASSPDAFSGKGLSTAGELLAPLMAPLVPLRQAFSQGEQLSYLASQQPEGAAKTVLNAAGDVVTGAEDLVGGVMEFMISPVGASTLGLGAAPAAIRAVVSAGFAADMANHAAGDYREFQKAKAAGDNVGQAEAIASGLRNLGMAGLAGSHAYSEAYNAIKPKTPLEQVAPLTAEAVAKVVPEPPQGTVFADLSKEKARGVYDIATDTIQLDPKVVATLTPEQRAELVRHEMAHKADFTSDYWMQSDTFLWKEWERDQYAPIFQWVRDNPNLQPFRGFNNAVSPEIMAELYAKRFEKGTLEYLDPQLGEVKVPIPPELMTVLKQFDAKLKAPPTTTPLTSAAVESVKKEPVPPPAPTPTEAVGESGKTTPVPAGVEPPAKVELAQEPPVAKPGVNIKIGDTITAKSHQITGLTHTGKVVSIRGDEIGMVNQDNAPVLVLRKNVEQSAPITKPEGERTLTTKPPKWTAATRAGVDLGKQTLAGIPDPVATIKAVIALAKEAGPHIKRAGESVARMARSAKEGAGEFVDEQMKAQRMTDYRRSVLNWSSKLQQSFGEADAAQKEIRKAVPDTVRREGITNWIQADGDAAVLRARADATADPKLKAGYEAALALTPEEIAVANDVRAAFAELGARGEHHDVLNSFKENYVTQTWDLGRGPASGGSRTLKEKFRFAKASTFPTYFDGEQAGYTPKTKDISKLLPMYLHEMNSVIAARQLVQEMATGVASDGRPLVAARGGGVPVEGDGGKATLIMPKKVAKDTGDYKVLDNQPALTGWRWASKDSDGNPIFLKADLALHPEAAAKLEDVLGKSAIKEWYNKRTGVAAQIPKMIVKGLDFANNETKRTMLGLLGTFHQVTEAWHGVGHRINPAWNIPKIDLVNDAGQVDATRHGLMLLPDRTSSEQFMEGFRHSGLISMLPKIGPVVDWYSHYLFQEFIPGLKYKTYQAIVERNQHVFKKELDSGELKLEDVKVLSGEQANAAYGHLNYADLARNPTIQHAARLAFLAPDFFEARARFTAQGVKGLAGAKVGREQVLALATLAIAQATLAWTAAQIVGGSWDPKHPFEMVYGDRRYTLRSIPEDFSGMISNTRQFAYARLSPIIGKGIIQYGSGVDYAGNKVTAWDTTKELATAPIPLPLRGFLGTSHRNLTAFEELAGSVGLRISRYLPEDVNHAIQLRDEVDLWINRSKKLDSDEERAAYLQKQLTGLSPEDRKKAVTRIKQRTAPGVRRRVR